MYVCICVYIYVHKIYKILIKSSKDKTKKLIKALTSRRENSLASQSIKPSSLTIFVKYNLQQIH